MITPEQAAGAVSAMRICRYFPSEDAQRAQVAAILIDMVETKAQLDWLVYAQCKLDWKGPYELRQLFCSRFPARDVEPTPKTSDQLEAEYFEAESRETDRRLAVWKHEQKLLGTAPVRIDLTPALNALTRTEEGVRRERRHRSTQEALERL